MANAQNSLYDVEVQSIEGKSYKMSDYKGKPILIVNTASKCGYTPQYKGLEALHEKYKDKGLVVLGMPSNQFGAQEPGSDKEIKEFCEVRYGVKFPMLKKADVKGANQHPLYKNLLSQSEKKSDVEWNFEKFLVGKDGKVVSRYSSKTEPMSPELTSAIEKAL